MNFYSLQSQCRHWWWKKIIWNWTQVSHTIGKPATNQAVINSIKVSPFARLREKQNCVLQRNSESVTPNILAKKSKEVPLSYCKNTAKFEDISWPGPVVRDKSAGKWSFFRRGARCLSFWIMVSSWRKDARDKHRICPKSVVSLLMVKHKDYLKNTHQFIHDDMCIWYVFNIISASALIGAPLQLSSSIIMPSVLSVIL
jgi:hypothetical protein